MIEINCAICHKELNEPGGLLIGPPFSNPVDKFNFTVFKYHLCIKCFDGLADKILPLILKARKAKMIRRVR